MSSKERKQRLSPESGGPFSSQIPGLVEKSISGPLDKARRAQKQLIEGAIQQPFYDDVIVTVAQIQRGLLGPHQSAQGINRATTFLSDLLHLTGTGHQGIGTKRINFSPQIIQAIREIKENDERIRVRPFIRSRLPGNYEVMISESLPILQRAIDQGSKGMDLEFALPVRPGEDLAQRNQERKEWNEWNERYNDFLPKLKDPTDTGVRDDFVDLLKEEPEQTTFPERKFFTSRYSGLSFAEIARLPYPAAPADLDRITGYLTAILKDNPSSLRREILKTLFFDQTVFNDPARKISLEVRNRDLLANLNLWQETFLLGVVYEQGPERERQTRELLRVIPEPQTALVAPALYQWAVYPLEKDPDFFGKFSDRISYHPLHHQAREQYRKDHPGMLFAPKGIDEIAGEYFQEVILPLFQKRLETFGVLAKFQAGIDIINKVKKELPYEKVHLLAIKDIFDRNCGGEFLARLERQKDEIWQITRSVWQEMTEQGRVHFLPLQQGLDIIEFSKDSTPDIFGIESVVFNTAGGAQEWQINIGFSLRDTYVSITGQLDQEGRLQLRAPFERETPGLYTMLNHIAVLTFHDLVRQEEMEKRPKEAGKATGGRGEDKTRSEGHKRHQQQFSAESLPRRQTDRHLIEAVCRKAGFTPRKVTMHRTYLPYAQTYETAVNAYCEALKSHEVQKTETSKAVLEWAEDELQKARRAFKYHPSEDKLKKLPPKFDLEQIQDSLTGEKRWLRTWVVEHDSPKPTEEELRSPKKLFERHYRGSSAVSFLDQFKPWFISSFAETPDS